MIVSGSFPNIPCGVSGHVDIIASRTAARGDYDVHVLTSDDSDVNLDLGKNYTIHPRIKRWSWFDSYTICKEIIRLKPDVIQIQNPTIKYYSWRTIVMCTVVPLLKFMAPDIRIVVMQHDIAVGKWLYRWRYFPMLYSADAILVSNARDYQAIIDQNISPYDVHIAPVGSHMKAHQRTPQQIRRSRQVLDIPEDSFCISYFGYVHPGRHIHVILEAIAKLREKNHPAHGLIMGAAFKDQDEYYENCKKRAVELGLEEHVTWTGFASPEQITDGLAATDVFVSLPERGADMRNTSIQTALLSQLPVVTCLNTRYYRDEDLENMGCVMISEINRENVMNAILEALDNPLPQPFLDRRSSWLAEDNVWPRHIDANIRAYHNQPALKKLDFIAS